MKYEDWLKYQNTDYEGQFDYDRISVRPMPYMPREKRWCAEAGYSCYACIWGVGNSPEAALVDLIRKMKECD